MLLPYLISPLTNKQTCVAHRRPSASKPCHSFGQTVKCSCQRRMESGWSSCRMRARKCGILRHPEVWRICRMIANLILYCIDNFWAWAGRLPLSNVVCNCRIRLYTQQCSTLQIPEMGQTKSILCSIFLWSKPSFVQSLLECRCSVVLRRHLPVQLLWIMTKVNTIVSHAYAGPSKLFLNSIHCFVNAHTSKILFGFCSQSVAVFHTVQESCNRTSDCNRNDGSNYDMRYIRCYRRGDGKTAILSVVTYAVFR